MDLGNTGTDQNLTAFLEARPRLFGIAYRMLGSAVDAEDIVQDVWLRWQAVDRTTVLDPPAYLATTTTRLTINYSQSARVRRESYVGSWLPEPVDTSADPALGAERGEALNVAVLLLLEKLTPTERAAYVLREAFVYPYPEIAEILQLSEPNTRQLVARARKHIAEGRRASVSADEHRRLLTAFLAAARQGDLTALENLLAADAVSYSDGGGAVNAARHPIAGRQRLAKVVAAFAAHSWNDATFAWAEANGRASLVIRRNGNVFAVLSIDASADGIHQLQWMLNPAKTAAWAASPANPQTASG